MATMSGALAVSSAHVTSGVPAATSPGLGLQSGERVHWATPTSAWASMASMARRYSSASQCMSRCK